MISLRYNPSYTLYNPVDGFDTLFVGDPPILTPKTEAIHVDEIGIRAGIRSYLGPRGQYHSRFWIGGQVLFEHLFLRGTPFDGKSAPSTLGIEGSVGHKWHLIDRLSIDPALRIAASYTGIGSPSGVAKSLNFDLTIDLRVGYVISPQSAQSSERRGRKRKRRSRRRSG